MADTVLTYANIEDLRYDPFGNNGLGEFDPKTIGTGGNPVEVRTVPASAPYVIKLFEFPQENAPSTTDIVPTAGGASLTEVSRTTTPGNNQYRVNYDDLGGGMVEFNSAQAGVSMDISYYGLGTLHQKHALDTRVPSSGNTDIDGIKTFSGNNIHNGNESFNGDIEIDTYTPPKGDFSTLKIAYFDLGTWNMDADSYIDITSDIESLLGSGACGTNNNIFKIKKMDIYIFSDFVSGTPATPNKISNGGDEINLSFINSGFYNKAYLSRKLGGSFDNSNFSGTSVTRGYIYLEYVL